MKKFTIVMFFVTSITNAQFNYGPTAGLVVSTIEVGQTVAINPENKTSYSVGVFSEYKFSDIAVNFAVSYGNFGSNGKTTGSNEIKVKEDMFIIDLTANYYLTDKFSIGAGGYYGKINNVKHKISNYGTIDMTNKYESSDLGIILKTNYRIYKGLFVEMKYNFGIANIYKRDEIWNTLPNPAEFEIEDEIKNRILTLSLGYSFN